jgi:hypothetical protein
MVAVLDPVLAVDINAWSQGDCVRLVQAVAQSLATNANTAITFGAGSEDIDTNDLHSTTVNTSRITIKVAGYYRVTATLWLSAATFSDIQIQNNVAKNGSVIPPTVRTRHTSATSTARNTMQVSVLQQAAVGDYFEMIGYQNTGGGLNTQTGGSTASVLEAELVRLA